MIKVEHTKIHLILAIGLNPEKRTLVTDAELVLVECKPKEALLIGQREKLLLYNRSHIYTGLNRYFKPIQISRTEEIKEGDWFYVSTNKHIKQCVRTDGKAIYFLNEKDGYEYLVQKEDEPFKILALPEHFSPEQLQMIVDGKLKEGKCMVECENIQTTKREDYQWTPEGSNLNYVDVIKLNPHITIYPPVEEKMYTRMEVRTILHKFNNPQSNEEIFKVNTWFEQNVE